MWTGVDGESKMPPSKTASDCTRVQVFRFKTAFQVCFRFKQWTDNKKWLLNSWNRAILTSVSPDNTSRREIRLCPSRKSSYRSFTCFRTCHKVRRECIKKIHQSISSVKIHEFSQCISYKSSQCMNCLIINHLFWSKIEFSGGDSVFYLLQIYMNFKNLIKLLKWIYQITL